MEQDQTPPRFTTEDFADFASLGKIGSCVDHIHNTISAFSFVQQQSEQNAQSSGELRVADGLGYISQQQQQDQQAGYGSSPSSTTTTTTTTPTSITPISSSTCNHPHISGDVNSTSRHYVRQLRPPHFPSGVPRLNTNM
jgi:hypothetical protein